MREGGADSSACIGAALFNSCVSDSVLTVRTRGAYRHSVGIGTNVCCRGEKKSDALEKLRHLARPAWTVRMHGEEVIPMLAGMELKHDMKQELKQELKHRSGDESTIFIKTKIHPRVRILL